MIDGMFGSKLAVQLSAAGVIPLHRDTQLLSLGNTFG